ncbi:MAG: acylphosphatase [Deltaproteobacteria bacterium]|nr:acylphosphatase [Deltaproteobacteria bacterium]
MTAASAVPEVQRLHAVVVGRVQNVGFRATTHEQALRLKLAGWVRNRHEGTVEVVAEGHPNILNEFLAFLRQGPRTAHVVRVDATWGPAEGAPQPFAVKPTI